MENKDKRVDIVSFLKVNGPSLPVHIAKKIDTNTLFAGAFLSELYRSREVMMSHMKVGNSPLYLLPGQETSLEKFASYLSGKEKDAFLLLKNQGVLQDAIQPPPIRVALRSIKDFAVPIKFNNLIYWKYFTLTKPEVQELLDNPSGKLRTVKAPSLPPAKAPSPNPKIIPKPKQPIKKEITSEDLKEQAEKEIEKEILEEQGEGIEKPKTILSSILKPKPKLDVKEKFLEQITKTLEEKQVKIIEIEKYDKKQLTGIVEINKEKYLLVAFNKKRFNEADLLRIYRKYHDNSMPFYFLSKGELAKKTEETIKACKKLKAVGTFE